MKDTNSKLFEERALLSNFDFLIHECTWNKLSYNKHLLSKWYSCLSSCFDKKWWNCLLHLGHQKYIFLFNNLSSLLKFGNNLDVKIVIFMHLNVSIQFSMSFSSKVGLILDSCYCFQVMKHIHRLECFCFCLFWIDFISETYGA